MKKIIAITLAAVLAAATLAACGSKTETAEAEGSTEVLAETSGEVTGTDVSSDAVSILETDAEGNYIKPESYGTVAKLGNYKGLEVTLEDATVTDEEVESEINDLLESNAELTPVDRAAKLGDVCSIDYVGKKDGVAFDGGTGSNDLELGSGTFIDGFEDGLVGAKKGDTVTLDLTFPEDYYSEELAGQPTTFEVTVNEVSEKKVPELTDEWVKTYTSGEETSAEEFKKGIRQDLEEYRKLDVESNAKNQLVTEILENSEVTVEDAAIEFEYQSMMKTYSDYAEVMGMSVDEYFEAYGVDPQAMKIQLSYYAEESAKQRLVEDAIFDAEGMTLTDDDRQALADLYDYDVETMQSLYGEDNFDIYAKSYKVVEFIYNNAVLK